MSSAQTALEVRKIDGVLLREIYASDQDIYPAQLSFERLQSWVTAWPELSIAFRGRAGGSAEQDVGVVIVLPIVSKKWELVHTGQVKETEIDPDTMFPSREAETRQDVGLHIFHIERFEGFPSEALGSFATYSLKVVDEIVEKMPWTVCGHSALTATEKGRRSFSSMGFTVTSYEEYFVKSADDDQGGRIEMVCSYRPHGQGPRPEVQGTIIGEAKMMIRSLKREDGANMH